MLLFESSSSDDDIEMFIRLAFLYQAKRLNRRKRSRLRRLRRQSRTLPRPITFANSELEAKNDDVVEVGDYDESLSFSSGYEREDSSLLMKLMLTHQDDDSRITNEGRSDDNVVDVLSNTVAEENCPPSAVGCILKCKSGFKCRLCPRILCKTQETLKAHLKSTRHARSEILLIKGRLRLIRNSDGEVEGEINARAEWHARIAAAALIPANSRKEKGWRQKRRNRLKKSKREDAKLDTASLSAKHPAKKRLTFED